MNVYEATVPGLFVLVEDQYESSLQDVGGSVALQANALSRTASAVMGFAQSAAISTITKMVLADQPSQSLTFDGAMAEVIRQMGDQGKTVLANVITTTPTQLTGTVGNGVIVTSTKRGDGLVQENTIAESLRLVCTNDAYGGTATAGTETFGLVGSPATSGTWDWDFPSGSAAGVSVDVISADTNATATSNLTTNGDMETWTTAVPADTLDNWTLSSGVWGTDAQKDATNPNRGLFCLQFLPTATSTAIYQEFNTTTGTAVEPEILSSYGVNLWLRKLSGTITGGVLTVELVDSTGAVINDEQGVANQFTVTLSTLTTSYVAYNGVFRIPATPPAVMRLRLRLSNALVGASFLIDDVCFAPLNNMYSGGPGFVVFSGATQFAGGDGWSIVNTNNQGGASNLATFQTGFQRLFQMRSRGFLLPSASVPNISNALITA